MSASETILRIAAKGDGVTETGRHVPLTAPGDNIAADGSVIAGVHHQQPPCRHFPECGGCQLQQLDEESWRGFVTDRVVNAAQGQGVEPVTLEPAALSPPRSRRRATLHVEGRGKDVRIGFRQARSHRIVDMMQCEILTPDLFALIAPLRQMFRELRLRRLACDINLAEADQGVDCGIKGWRPDGLAQTEQVIAFAQANGLARLTLDDGYGAEAHWEPDRVTITLAGVTVPMPPGAFLQPTREGEQALTSAATSYLDGAGTVADLFAGLGTFAFALSPPQSAKGTKVLAAEAARDLSLACRQAADRHGARVFCQHRDLFRNPLLPDELDRFAAVLIDPPRAGAREQVERLAESRVERICYISCNPSSWARDAAVLVAAGWRLEKLRPVGQFRWSTHVELASLFVR
ncbi:class I SAM-dependent RNA methyltransferase [Croceicoccus sp. F390]|uniref:Class I SAM-dependent RNA methyltransferase n=1 Tax=Croceicoccus esteveae TaxID=3075597 RepID=A0ABU2ZFB8_9SPHN|nr:class I SAM-dependent RNA methyltransferase [Croceicoccus sp. F390]MDT0575290.1 class I SAM-dependent RNA methyltransferase [Croceicoccus sp. F390]